MEDKVVHYVDANVSKYHLISFVLRLNRLNIVIKIAKLKIIKITNPYVKKH